jgi:2-keto-3-deoxy-L-rhamnonate aldolase RhmA
LQKNKLKELYVSGKPAFGLVINLAQPNLSEIAGHSGFDFVIIDMEHTSLSVSDVEAHVRTCETVGLCSMVRVPSTEPGLIKRLLETGVQGLVFPHLQSVDDVANAVSMIKYPPIGSRGSGGSSRAAYFGAIENAIHQKVSNDTVLLVGLVEDPVAFDRLDSIVQADGIDIIWPGAGDLSSAMGFPGQLYHPAVHEKIVAAFELTRARGKQCLISASNQDRLEEWAKRGANLFLLGELSRLVYMTLRDRLASARSVALDRTI